MSEVSSNTVVTPLASVGVLIILAAAVSVGVADGTVGQANLTPYHPTLQYSTWDLKSKLKRGALMSRDTVTEFMRSIAHDKEIMEQLVGYAAQRGYEFSVSDLKNHFASALGDADLESVVGGAAKKKPAKKNVMGIDP